MAMTDTYERDWRAPTKERTTTPDVPRDLARSGPLTGVVKMDGAAWRSVMRGRSVSRSTRWVVWLVGAAALLAPLILVATAIGVWMDRVTVWRYVDSTVSPFDRAIARLFMDDAATPVFVLFMIAALATFVGLWLLRQVGMGVARFAQRRRQRFLDGAKVSIDRDGVSISGADLGARIGWSRIDHIGRSRGSVVITSGALILPISKSSMDRPADEAVEQIEFWRNAAASRSVEQGF